MSIQNFLSPNNYDPVYIKGLIVQDDETVHGNLTVDGQINGNIVPGTITPGANGQVLSTIGGVVEWANPAAPGTGTVTSVSVAAVNGVSGVVANPTTTPAISLTLGNITPASVVAAGNVSGANLSGTNTGDQTITLTSDVTGTGTGSFATTISNNAITTPKINNSAVTYAKLQNASATTIIGNPTNGATTPSEITLGSGLSFSGSTLVATGSGGSVTNVSVTNTTEIDGTVTNPTTTPAISLSLNNASIAYSKIQNEGAATLLGNPTGASTSPSEITLGTNLSFAGSVLNATVGSPSVQLTGDVTGGPSTSPIATTIAANAVTYSKMQNESAVTLLGNPTVSSHIPTEIPLDPTLSFSVAGTLQRAALTGDVTAPVASNTTTIAANAVTTTKVNNSAITYAKIQNETASTLLGNPTGASAAPSEITLGTNLSFSGSVLNATGGSGPITLAGDVFGASNANGITANAVTYAKFQQSVGGNTVLCNAAGAGNNYGEVALAASTLLGRSNTGSITAITMGTGVTINSGQLLLTGFTEGFNCQFGSFSVGTGTSRPSTTFLNTFTTSANGTFNNSSGLVTSPARYTAPSNGIYQVSISIYGNSSIAATATPDAFTAILLDSTASATVFSNTVSVVNTSSTTVDISRVCQLTAAHVYAFQFMCTLASSLVTVTAGTNNTVSIQRIA